MGYVLGSFWCLAGALMVAVGAVAVAVWLADASLAGAGWARRPRPARLPGGWQALRLAGACVVALGCLVGACWVTLRYSQVPSLEQFWGAVGPVLAAGIGGIAALAALDALITHLQFVASAAMSRRELAEELRETHGPEVIRREKRRRLWRRRQR